MKRLLAVLVVVLSACGSSTPTDAGTPIDASAPHDAPATLDAPMLDSPMLDAPMLDAPATMTDSGACAPLGDTCTLDSDCCNHNCFVDQCS